MHCEVDQRPPPAISFVVNQLPQPGMPLRRIQPQRAKYTSPRSPASTYFFSKTALGAVAVVELDHELDAVLLRRVHHLLALRCVAGEGLLSQAVLAGVQHVHAKRHVELVGDADADAVNVRRQHGLVIGEDVRDAELARDVISCIFVDIANSHNIGLAGLLVALDVILPIPAPMTAALIFLAMKYPPRA